MISVKEVEEIHQTLIHLFGGSVGLKDLSSLESSLARPFQTFNEKELHQSPINKAAANYRMAEKAHRNYLNQHEEK